MVQALQPPPLKPRPRSAQAVRRYRAHAGERRWSRGENLLPVEVAVDANRDGEITFDGKDKTTNAKPFRFWVNDDRDIGHTVDGDDWEQDDVESLARGKNQRESIEKFGSVNGVVNGSFSTHG